MRRDEWQAGIHKIVAGHYLPRHRRRHLNRLDHILGQAGEPAAPSGGYMEEHMEEGLRPPEEDWSCLCPSRCLRSRAERQRSILQLPRSI